MDKDELRAWIVGCIESSDGEDLLFKKITSLNNKVKEIENIKVWFDNKEMSLKEAQKRLFVGLGAVIKIGTDNKNQEVTDLRKKLKECETDNDVCAKVSVETEGIIMDLRKSLKEYKETLEVMSDKNATAAIIKSLRKDMHFHKIRADNLMKYETQRVEEKNQEIKDLRKRVRELEGGIKEVINKSPMIHDDVHRLLTGKTKKVKEK